MFKNNVVNCVREHLDKWYATGNHQETAIQLVDEYEERIMADERRKFAEWMFKETPYMDCSVCTFVGDCHKKDRTCVETLLYEYEKEQK